MSLMLIKVGSNEEEARVCTSEFCLFSHAPFKRGSES
jgi:hypothetical protein